MLQIRALIYAPLRITLECSQIQHEYSQIQHVDDSSCFGPCLLEHSATAWVAAIRLKPIAPYLVNLNQFVISATNQLH